MVEARPAVAIADDGGPRARVFQMDGDEIHGEVAVGPVHAGVIEPGHFRFQCHGEHVFTSRSALGYQRRGIERALVGGPWRTIHQIETIAGDDGWAHDGLPPT